MLLHVRTVKGKGWAHAEETPDAYHGVSPFDLATGKPLNPSGRQFLLRVRRGAEPLGGGGS